MSNGNAIRAFAGILTLGLFLSGMCGAGLAFQEQIVPVVDGRLGGCSADFTVRGRDGIPVYDAKIDVEIRHGFLGLRRLSLQVGTNSDGRARVAGLPDARNKTYRFQITGGRLNRTVVMDTAEGCEAVFEVLLE
jgi:hypothetical protein